MPKPKPQPPGLPARVAALEATVAKLNQLATGTNTTVTNLTTNMTKNNLVSRVMALESKVK